MTDVSSTQGEPDAPPGPGSTRPCRTRPGSGTTGWAARTTTRSTARPATSSARSTRASWTSPGPTAPSSGAWSATWPGEAGVRQFLDVGTGLPTADNTHQVAQRVAPESRIVYVDNDPLVLAHARALLTSSPEGTTHYVDANMADPGKVLQEAAQWLDLTQPVALTFMGVLGHVIDHDEARGHRRPGCSTACRPAATWPSTTASTRARRSRRPCGYTRHLARSRTGPARRSSSPATSTAWSWSSRAWSWSTDWRPDPGVGRGSRDPAVRGRRPQAMSPTQPLPLRGTP